MPITPSIIGVFLDTDDTGPDLRECAPSLCDLDIGGPDNPGIARHGSTHEAV